MCGREFFKLLRISTLKLKKSVWKKGFRVVESIKLTRVVKDCLQSFQSFEKSVYCSISVQNIFFSNGILESHGKV